MSALRISVPGRPVELIHLGYSKPRIDRARAPSARFTPLTDVAPAFQRGQHLDKSPSKPLIRRPSLAPRCGMEMRGRAYGHTCGRRQGHKDHCKSEAAVAVDNMRRRSRGDDGHVYKDDVL